MVVHVISDVEQWAERLRCVQRRRLGLKSVWHSSDTRILRIGEARKDDILGLDKVR
jgi:hypothetical protein